MAATMQLRHGETFGTPTLRCESEGVVFTRLRHDTPRKLPHHAHASAFFTMLVRGGYRERAGRREIDYTPVSVVFHPPELSHLDEICGGASVLVMLEVPRRFLSETAARTPPLAPQTFDASRVLLSLCSAAGEGLLTPLAVENAAVELVGTAANMMETEETFTPRWLAGAVERLRSESNVRIADLARDANVHPVHFSRVFRRRVGITPAEYAQRARIGRALRMLGAEGRPLAEVATASGFADQSHFCRAVRAAFGLTPRALRALTSA